MASDDFFGDCDWCGTRTSVGVSWCGRCEKTDPTINLNETINKYFDIPQTDKEVSDDMEDVVFKIFGKIVQRKRSYLGISQDVLAEKIGLNRTSVTNIEAGNQKLPFIKMLKIFNIIGESFGEFIKLIEKELKIN